MNSDLPKWPRLTGASLLLVPIGHRESDWVKSEEHVQHAIEHLNVLVKRGIAHCPSYVGQGAAAMLGGAGADALVFACPSDIGVFEAAPLVSVTERPHVMLGEVSAFFRKASEAALAIAPKVAWVAAHEWNVGDRVRWDSGSLDQFCSFVTRAGAWRTTFLFGRTDQVVECDDWPYWFEVTG